jgi:phosphate/sulfate permease
MMGALLEGDKMSHSLFGGLTNANVLDVQAAIVLSTLFVSIVSLFIFSAFHIPCSLSIITATAFAGSILSLNIALNVGYAAVLVASWILSPLVSGVLAVLVYQPLVSLISRFNLAWADLVSRLSVILGIFLISYVLGANNVGFLNGLYVPILHQFPRYQLGVTLTVTISTILGIIILGRTITETVGEKFVVLSPQGVFASIVASVLCIWSFTQFGIPLSITHVLIGSVIGATLTKRIALFNRRILFRIIFGAAGSALLGVAAAIVLMKMISP